MTLRAGTLNQRVRIERLDMPDPQTPQAQELKWVLVASAWASVRLLSGREVIAADAPMSRIRASVRARYRRDIRAGMRVSVDSLILRVEAVLPDVVRREYIDLVCVSDER